MFHTDSMKGTLTGDLADMSDDFDSLLLKPLYDGVCCNTCTGWCCQHLGYMKTDGTCCQHLGYMKIDG